MAEKTEQPTPKRIRDSREKGDIAKGQDVAPAATVLAIGAYMYGNAQGIYENLVLLVSIPMEVMGLPYEQALAKAVPAVLDLMIAIVAPIVAVVMSTAFVAIIAQTAPLLGLFGTFVGGIHAVNALNGAALVARADLLSGLMEALVAAAAGLLVGIPAQVMYSVLRVRFERLVIELEAAASEVLVLLTAQRGASA